MFLDDQDSFADWLNKATKEEEALVDKVYDLDDYFEDMIFGEGTSTYELMQCKGKLSDKDVWINDDAFLREELRFFSLACFRYHVDDISEGLGYFDAQNGTLCVTPESVNNDVVILHEMIHLHEYVINELPLFYHDTLYWALYKDLKMRIPRLDDIITSHAHILVGSQLYYEGGMHDILFLLKSFDLDIRKDYPLGTIFAYGRADDFKEYCYVK